VPPYWARRVLTPPTSTLRSRRPPALGYVTDATKADKAKYPKYATGAALPGQTWRRERPLLAVRG